MFASSSMAVDRPFQGWDEEDVLRDYGPEVRGSSRFHEGVDFKAAPFRALYNLEDGTLSDITYSEEGFVIEVESDTTDRVWRYENLFDTGLPVD